MDYVAMRERSVAKLARWRRSDPGVLALHCEALEWPLHDVPLGDVDLGG